MVEKTQTGLRLDASVLKVLKGLAEYKDMSLGDLVEGKDGVNQRLEQPLSV